MITYYNPYELYHHGVKGQKWGVRRFQNRDGTSTSAGKKRRADNYSDEQRKRDSRVYSKGASKRINKRMLNGESVSGARSAEADRISRYRKAAGTAGTVGKVIGTVAGVSAGLIVGYKLAGSRWFNDFLYTSNIPDMAIPAVKGLAASAIATGTLSVGASLGSFGGQSITMLTGGYSPSKYREGI